MDILSPPPVWLILGPSGAGKSSFGRWLATEQNWLHLEIDPPAGGDGINQNNLRREWDEIYARKTAIIGSCFTTAPRGESQGGLCPNFLRLFDSPAGEDVGAIKVGIRTICLYGSAAHCITAFLNREQTHLDLHYWISQNHKMTRTSR